MSAGPCLDTKVWLSNQNSVIGDLFTRATEELQAIGVRVLTGSHAPSFEVYDKFIRIQLRPLRFSSECNDDALSLSMSASAQGGPPRYVIALEAHGEAVAGALRRLSACNQEYWQKFYVRRGLWLDSPQGTYPLNDLSKLSGSNCKRITLSGVFLHSDLTKTIQAGLYVMGLLYRSVLDELSGASKFRNLTAQLEDSLGGNHPLFQHGIRP
jgi:hypothetical protein